jgi:hypothetical protein
MTENDKRLIVGIEDGWICPSSENLKRYYKLTNIDIHPIRTWFKSLINRLKENENDGV